MEKIKIGKTYGYRDFISEEERINLYLWTEQNSHRFILNGPGRKFGIIDQFEKYQLIETLRSRIINLEKIQNFKEEPHFRDYIGINTDGGSIHIHTDPNQGDYVHTRYNVLISYPDQGGESIYGGEVNKLQERLVWKCIAGLVYHGSTPVVGKKPRITLSLGFLINDRK